MSRSALLLCLLAAVCGAAPPKRAYISTFPWHVALHEILNDGSLSHGKPRHICSGSIISSIWVLTAAFCTNGRTPQQLLVKAGTAFHEFGGIVYNVTRIIEHEGYDGDTLDYDIALLEIPKPISFGRRVQAVMLGSTELASGTEVAITGWSHRKEQLQVGTRSIIDHDICKAGLKIFHVDITESMMCAGEEDDDFSVDAGAPVVVGNTQYAIVSWGDFGCNDRAYPSIYSSVPAVRSWITEKTSI